VVLAGSCAHRGPVTGHALATRLERASRSARARLAAHDTTGALRLLRDAARGTARGAERDLIHGHLEARAYEAEVLGDLAALSAATGDTAGARATFERLLLTSGSYGLLDSLERSPFYRALDATSAGGGGRRTLGRLRRTWRDSAFVSPYRDTLPLGERLAGIALVWAEARYSFVGLGGQGASWDSVFLATLARVTRPMDTWGYYQEVERLLFALDDDHSDVMQLPAPLRRHRAGVPLDARRVDGHVIVTRLRSPSLSALGVRVGQEIVAIEGLTPERYVAERVPPQLGFSTPQARDANTYGWQLWLGEAGTELRLRLRDPDGTEREAALHRDGWTDIVRDPVVEARMLEDGIGYLALNSFGDPRAGALIDSSLATLGELRGLIVDTRRNSGGSQDAGWHLLARFIRQPFVQVEQYSSAYVGIWRAWGGLPPRVPMPERILVPDLSRHRDYPLLWLIGPRTASAAEGVAAMAEQTGAATTVGETTFGSTGQPLLVPLPGGGVARIRVEEERFNDGRAYTRRGIPPMVPIPVTVEGLRAGRDEVLEGALALMRRKLAGRR
jgi:C-terminal processing protease CtpA/Prc